LLELREVPPESDWPAHIARLRRWYRAYWLLVLSAIPLLFVLVPLAEWIVGAEWGAMIPAFGWFAAILVVQIRTNTFLCPRCGEPIRPLGGLQPVWDVRCLRCDLRISRGKGD